MKLEDFDFDLPLELIAQKPASLRDHSRLLIVPKNAQDDFKHTEFYNIIDYFNAGDVIVLNNSKVLKAKLELIKNGKKIEFYLNKNLSGNKWLGFAKPARKIADGDEFYFDSHKIIIRKKMHMGETEIEFLLDNMDVTQFLEIYGQMPLPPYIKRHEAEKSDINRYQTVFAKTSGSVAAPTAGLHFTEELIDRLQKKGVQIVYVTLHVGSGTFLPVKTENIDDHKMHSEFCVITKQAAKTVNLAKQERRRVIAVGTTALRALESAAIDGRLEDGEFETSIFIKPGFHFQIADLLLTNFHLPKSTLFILVCAFAGYVRMHDAYKYAIEQKMRFFSYGDAMLLYAADMALTSN